MHDQLKLKIGDYVEGLHNFALLEGTIKPGIKYKVIRVGGDQYELEGAGWWRCRTDNFRKIQVWPKAKCPTCGADPCACDDDVELDANIDFAHGFKRGSKVRFIATDFPSRHGKLATVRGSERQYLTIEWDDGHPGRNYYPSSFERLDGRPLESQDHIHSAGFEPIIHSGVIQGRLVPAEKTYKHPPLPARALTSWFSIHDKMAAAKHLNELKDE